MTKRLRKTVGVLIEDNKDVSHLIEILKRHADSLTEKRQAASSLREGIDFRKAELYIKEMILDIYDTEKVLSYRNRPWYIEDDPMPSKAVTAVSHCYSVAVASLHNSDLVTRPIVGQLTV